MYREAAFSPRRSTALPKATIGFALLFIFSLATAWSPLSDHLPGTLLIMLAFLLGMTLTYKPAVFVKSRYKDDSHRPWHRYISLTRLIPGLINNTLGCIPANYRDNTFAELPPDTQISILRYEITSFLNINALAR